LEENIVELDEINIAGDGERDSDRRVQDMLAFCRYRIVSYRVIQGDNRVVNIFNCNNLIVMVIKDDENAFCISL
jgi:hypothetical protein